MKRTSLIVSLAGVTLAPSALLAAVNFGAGYRENWDSYAAGRSDPTYNAVWSCYNVTTGTAGDQTYGVEPEYPEILVGSQISSSRNLRYEVKNRTLVNKLNDGISNPTIPAGTYGELAAGEVLKPDSTVPLNDTRSASNYDNLQLRNYFGFAAGSNRQHSGQYAELSFGNIHAPALTGGMTPLASPINVIALGKLPGFAGTFTGTVAVNNTAVFFFNGERWFNTGMATVAGTQGLVAKIFYSGLGATGWQAKIDYIFSTTPGSMGTPNTFDLAFDPTTLGFDTVSWNMLNVGTNQAGPFYDDVWVAGGLVVPEPAALGLLALASLMLPSRRRR